MTADLIDPPPLCLYACHAPCDHCVLLSKAWCLLICQSCLVVILISIYSSLIDTMSIVVLGCATRGECVFMLATNLCFGGTVLQHLLVSSWGGARSFDASMVLSQFCVQFVVIHLDII